VATAHWGDAALLAQALALQELTVEDVVKRDDGGA